MLSLKKRGALSMQISNFARGFFDSSSPLVPVALPSQRETHIWYIVPDEVQNTSLLNQYLKLLSSCERESMFRMSGDKLQKSSLLARTLVRTTLSRYTNCQITPRSFKFRKNTFGKPEIEWGHYEEWSPPALHFNVSHTSSLIACGVTVDKLVGVDVEEKQRKIKNDILSFARRYFSLHEVEHLHAILDPEIQRQEFIKLWTLKAYVKALGRGFSAAPFKTFTIRFRATRSDGLQVPTDLISEASEILVEAFDDPKSLSNNWQFGLLELANSHYAAICMEKENILEGKGNDFMKLKVWKTLPFVEDEYVSGTNAVKIICGLSQCLHL
ncbi:PREDICTED: uncharacterized protein LOC104604115 isoform X2 [Nelumbo nucifera]|uniref:holo-[acyl-carrier-protein] synthase n=1 Tax=Nelumbo nucifera TaxID=4432 RepID=A0A1U8AUP7_NELNU|nr:PREDICTED: uncharacterized protein LOC104604115 isoform X2 [Nelumbo nucifera]